MCFKTLKLICVIEVVDDWTYVSGDLRVAEEKRVEAGRSVK